MSEDAESRCEEPKKRRSHRDLIVWQKACDLVVVVYRITARFPTEERYGLTSQMRRCAASVPANIAEGAGRWGPTEFQHFLSITRGSLAELDTWVEVAWRVELISPDERDSLRDKTDELISMVIGLRQSLAPRKPGTNAK